MKEAVIVYGSTSGNCESAARSTAKALGTVNVVSAPELTQEMIAASGNLILGSSTWGCRDLQDNSNTLSGSTGKKRWPANKKITADVIA